MIASVLLAAGFVAAAYVLWPFMECVPHRFAFQEARGRDDGSRVHLGHHARPAGVNPPAAPSRGPGR